MSLKNNMNVFTTPIKNLPDLAKDYLFHVIFEYESGSSLSKIIGTDDFMFRAKTASIPAKTFGELSTHFMGSKLVYPGRATIDGELSVTFDEFQDLYISTALHRWSNLLFSQGFQDDIDAVRITGGASSNYLKDYTTTIKVVLYDSALKKKLPVEFKYYYAFPLNINSTELGQENENKITRQVNFKYSTFEVIRTGE